MAKLKLSKSALQQERSQLALYQRTLPSLDLKRRQLTVELGVKSVELTWSPLDGVTSWRVIEAAPGASEVELAEAA